MELILNNPYRIAGVYSNASTKEIQKNKTKITHYAGVGKAVNFENDFEFLGAINRDFSTVTAAFAQLQQNKDKLKHSLFWFVKNGHYDTIALEYLAQGNKEKATEIWEKVTSGRDIDKKNFSYFNNLGTLKLMSAQLTEIQDGIENKIKLIESSNFKNFVQLVADETFLFDNKTQAKLLVDDLLQMYNYIYKGKDAISLFAKCNGSTHQYLSQKLAEEPLHNIEGHIEATKKSRKSNKASAFQAGHNLYVVTQTDFSSLKTILGERDIRFKNIADNLAKEILQCAIDYFKELRDSLDPSKKSLRLIRFASFIAVGSQFKERINDNKKSIEDWAQTAAIQTEIKFITNELSAFQNKTDSPNTAQQLVHKCKPQLTIIKNKLGATDDFYLNISSAVANNAQGMLVSAVNSEQEKLEGVHSNDSKILLIFKFKEVLQEALVVSTSLGSLDMNQELRSRYRTNHSTLKSLVSQLNVPSSGRNPRTRPSSGPSRSHGGTNNGSNRSTKTVETFSANDGLPPWVYIVGVIILFIIFANACS